MESHKIIIIIIIINNYDQGYRQMQLSEVTKKEE